MRHSLFITLIYHKLSTKSSQSVQAWTGTHRHKNKQHKGPYVWETNKSVSPIMIPAPFATERSPICCDCLQDRLVQLLAVKFDRLICRLLLLLCDACNPAETKYRTPVSYRSAQSLAFKASCYSLHPAHKFCTAFHQVCVNTAIHSVCKC